MRYEHVVTRIIRLENAMDAAIGPHRGCILDAVHVGTRRRVLSKTDAI